MTIFINIAPDDSEIMKKENRVKTVLIRLFRNKLAVVAGIILILVILVAIFAPYITPYKYNAIDMVNKNQSPSAAHLLGTDNLGRDILSRIMYGARYSLTIAIIAVVAAVIVSMILGSVSGFFGGVVDNVIMRILDVFQAIPDLILTIAVSTALGSGFDKTILALSISCIPNFSRILRANVMKVRGEEYLEAAEAIGCSKFRRIVKYTIPNAWTSLIVAATMKVSGVILSLAALSYIGLGIQEPLPEWGHMLSAARGYIGTYTYQLIFPGMAIAICVLCLNILGDGLRDALDPRLKD